ncbi:hypothetical protein VNO77_24327 [Canavalia gladiata]|uniref:RanBP2-type domain-containing protein n=1 Tax=Canavalia gladiata TaxID=3824 RepID=A0AAN9QCE4_CANGL
MCGVCQHINFKKRDICQSCGYLKYGGPDPSTYRCNRTGTLAGDWFCTAMNCEAHNYASRSNCYRCGSRKDYCFSGYGENMAGSGGYGSDNFPPGWKIGDWICPRLKDEISEDLNITDFPQHLSSPNTILSCFLHIHL